MAREDKRKKQRGEAVARKLMQTRRVKADKQAKLLRVVTVCYTDELMDDSFPEQDMKQKFKRCARRTRACPWASRCPACPSLKR